MVRSVWVRPTVGVTAALSSGLAARQADEGRLRRPSNRWLLGPALILAALVAAGSALGPLRALLALPLLVVVACVWKWPALAAYLVIGLTPLAAGINRGAAIPLLRPNEALALFLGLVLATRGIAQLRTGQLPKLRLGAVEASMVLLAVCSSVVPLWWMTVQQQAITNDDLLYALVLWKYLGLYALIRMSVPAMPVDLRCRRLHRGGAGDPPVAGPLRSSADPRHLLRTLRIHERVCGPG